MKKKRLLASAMAMIMAFSTFVPVGAFAQTDSTAKDSVRDLIAESMKSESVSKDIRLEGKAKTDSIRIIVELEKEAVIDRAISMGLRVSDMNESVVTAISDDLINRMDAVQTEMKAESIQADIHYEFVNVINGFSATTTIQDAEKIEALPNVKRVLLVNEYERPEPVDPNMITSNDIINSEQTWDLDLKGAGMIVAVIDSSFEPTHPSMQNITRPGKAKIKSAADLPSDVPGQFYNIKMPYGYNYWDNTQNLAATSNHGTHVAGTVGANGDLSTGGIKGVAPEAQVLGMKVFGDDPSIATTYDDIYIRAIEDAIKLGADAINMSLGSTASFLEDEDQSPARLAIRKAAESGIIVAVSAGNSNRFGSGQANPKALSPDVGLVGAPSLNPDTFSVASIENTHVQVPALVTPAGKYGYQISGKANPAEVLAGKSTEYVFCGIGAMPGDISASSLQNDFEGKDLTGKIALIQRGAIGFGVKILNAQKLGAAAVIVFNSAAGGDAIMGMSYGAQEAEITIPAVFIGMSNGNILKNSDFKTVEFTNEMTAVPNVNIGKMSDFTSYGTTPSLDFKPEVAAPGGSIYSTLQGGKYGLMSGTSMAAPHVAGGSALVLQRIDEEIGVVGKDRATLAKNLMMSTATPLKDRTTSGYTSPRREGAGVLDLLSAVTTNVIIVDSQTGISKVNMKEVGSEFTYSVTVKNIGTEDVLYDISGTVQSELVENNRITLLPVYLQDASIKFTANEAEITEINVPANSEVSFDVTVDVSKAKMNGVDFNALYPNGGFVEGFLRLTDRAEKAPTIGLPYISFYGDWNKGPILDVSIYDKTNGDPAKNIPANLQFYGAGYNGLYTEVGEDTPFLGSTFEKTMDKTKIAISPNGDKTYDTASSYFTFLRNAKEYEVNILSKDREVLKTVELGSNVRKHFFDSDAKNPKAKDFGNWDGTINGAVVEGDYIYQIKAKIDYSGKDWQYTEFPITVDNTKAVLSDLKYEPTTLTVSGKVKDNFAVKSLYVTVGDSVLGSMSGVDKTDFSFVLPTELPRNTVISVYAYDFAGNETAGSITYKAIVDDKKAPTVSMPAPPALDILSANEVEFKGTVTDPTGLKSITFDGVESAFTYDEATSKYSFAYKANYEDGPHGVQVVATDLAGNKFAFERKFYVDGTAPVITVSTSLVPTVSNSTTSIKIEGTVSDNYSGLKFYSNGSMKLNAEGILDKTPVVGITKKFSETYKLATGINKINLKVVDAAGNDEVKTIEIYRMLPNETGPTITAVVAPGKNVSSENPVKIDLSADKQTDWKVKIMDPSNKEVTNFSGTGLKLSRTWAPDAGIKVNGTYKVIVNYTQMGTAKTAEYTFEVYNYPVKIKNVNVVKRSGTFSVEAELENLSNGVQNPMLVVQVTNDLGQVVNLSTATLKGLQSNQTVELSSGFALPTNGRYNVEVFVWTGWNNSQVLGEKVDTYFVVD